MIDESEKDEKLLDKIVIGGKITNMKFYKIDEAAKLLKIHPETMRRYVREGKIKTIRIGGTVRIEQSAIDSLSDSSN